MVLPDVKAAGSGRLRPLVRGLLRVTCTECSARAAMVIAGCIGLGYVIFLLGPAVAFGSGSYWLFPNAPMGGTGDMASELSGYYWFVQDVWRWPLLALPGANWPDGTNAGMFDCIPILAIIGKLLRQSTGHVFNLLPLWIDGCFVLNSAALTALVRALGQRSIIAAVLAASLGALSPIVHFRFGQSVLLADWLFVFALVCYVASKNVSRISGLRLLGLFGLCVLAVGVNLYLYVMTAAIVCAIVLQAAVDGRLQKIWAAGFVPLIVCAGIVPVWAYGMFADPALREHTVPFGYNSMNALAPFWPQSSGAFQWTGLYALTRGSIGATPGQFEGFSYLGLGTSVLALIAVVARFRTIAALARTNWVLLVVLAVLTAWALSNHIYAGPFLVASYPLPAAFLDTIGAWFRASGRFFWPVAWLIVALGIAGALARRRPLAILVIAAVAIGLQWLDLSVLRSRITNAIANRPPSVFGSAKNTALIENEMRAAGRVIIVPSVYCMAPKWSTGTVVSPQYLVADQVQLMAARVNALSNSTLVAHPNKDCDRERRTSLAHLTESGILFAISQPAPFDRTAEAKAAFKCSTFALGLVCNAQNPSVGGDARP